MAVLSRKIAVDFGPDVALVMAKGDDSPTSHPPVPTSVWEGAARIEVEDIGPIDGYLSMALGRSLRHRLFRPDVLVALTGAVEPAARRELVNALGRTDVRSIYAIERVLAAAVAVMAPLDDPLPTLVGLVDDNVIEVAAIVHRGVVSNAVERLSPDASADERGEVTAKAMTRCVEETSRRVGSAHIYLAGGAASEQMARVVSARLGRSVEVAQSPRDVVIRGALGIVGSVDSRISILPYLR